jgi:GDP/UDP-N,N'-diacetylbacillosamine 2-epimerase (hydrolysing)
MSKLISVVTGSRADFGLLQGVIQGIENSPNLDLELIVTGSHLSEFFGNTINEISISNSTGVFQIELNLELDNESQVGFAVSEVIHQITEHYSKRSPSMCLVLGDRYEILGAAVACASLGIPLGHIHGGEITSGSRDDLYRHAITKLASLHFVATPEFQARVIRMGETPERVFVVGGLGVDAINRLEILTKSELEKRLKISIQPKYALVTYHPDSLSPHDSLSQLSTLLEIISKFPDFQFFITGANADYYGIEINSLLSAISAQSNNFYFFESLGQQIYLSLVREAQFVLGNSSSGLLEVPSYGVPTINIGTRQAGRPRAQSVIDVELNEPSIYQGVLRATSEDFLRSIKEVENPYGEPGAGTRILEILEVLNYTELLPKKFFDAR